MDGRLSSTTCRSFWDEGDGHEKSTHYCSMGNQPRMRAAPVASEVKSLTFDFIDATNLSSAESGHMRKLVVTFQGPNHFTQEWTMREKGKNGTGRFEFARKK